jgi:hypothetical protein
VGGPGRTGGVGDRTGGDEITASKGKTSVGEGAAPSDRIGTHAGEGADQITTSQSISNAAVDPADNVQDPNLPEPDLGGTVVRAQTTGPEGDIGVKAKGTRGRDYTDVVSHAARMAGVRPDQLGVDLDFGDTQS